jgi:hypothetical protein
MPCVQATDSHIPIQVPQAADIQVWFGLGYAFVMVLSCTLTLLPLLAVLLRPFHIMGCSLLMWACGALLTGLSHERCTLFYSRVLAGVGIRSRNPHRVLASLHLVVRVNDML